VKDGPLRKGEGPILLYKALYIIYKLNL